MSNKKIVSPDMTLNYHIGEVQKEHRRFENAYMTASRMFIEPGFKKIVRGGQTVYDYNFFRHAIRDCDLNVAISPSQFQYRQH